ncbi:uncharacterized protein LOC126376832 [Pectinophora gossypiella]|uniref:uncharacterized protein LOC126376832 n=1 Tax=Pectinophora gossypiella TaxID=13191 RepID=UPI00214E7080|nr:uncharacterized protein LOC126376832 [Pectinophora gossypiella]
MPPESDELDSLGLKCIPGRTVLRMPSNSKTVTVDGNDDDNDPDDYNRLRKQKQRPGDADLIRELANNILTSEKCKICICSAEGKDEYCSERAANTVNECIRLATINAEFENGGLPFDHTRDLSQRIRRDLIWHKDEIPYVHNAKCRRGMSYYSNDPSANDTDLDVQDATGSLLTYSDKTICFFCVCSTSGSGVGCISRSPYFCDYYRFLNRDSSSTMRDVYTSMFQQDRPSYFRTLAYRVRRTMDDGMYALILNVGPSVDGPCVPYVSEYTDCNDGNQCTGCTRCSCSSDGTWMCSKVHECPREQAPIDEKVLNSAFNTILYEYSTKKTVEKSDEPAAKSKNDDLVLGEHD